MKQEVKIGQTDYTVLILIRDSTTGAPKTALTFASAGIDVCYTRVETDNDVVLTAGAPVTTTLTGVHVDWGFVLVDNTNAPGLYKLDIADGVFATGAWSAVVSLICTGCDPVHIEFMLVPEAPYAGVNTSMWLGTAVTAATGGIPDVNTKNINNVAAATPGAAGGVAIAGSNAATTFASLTCTGELTVSNGIVVTCSTANKTAISATGNGTGNGIAVTSGAGATGTGISVACGGSNGSGMLISGAGSGHGISTAGGATGHGLHAQGGGTSGNGINADGGYTGSGIKALGYLTGNGITATGGSSTGAGILATGGANHASSDGIRATAGGALANGIETDRILANNTMTITEGIAAAITGNITGNLSGSIGTCPNPAGVTTLLAKLPGDTKTGVVTTDAGNSATSFETDLTEATNDYWKDCLLLITSGVMLGQVKKVTGYAGATKIITVSGGFTATPADGVTFILINQ